MGKYRYSSAAAALLLALLLCVLNIVLGSLNLDEGWYLLAARNYAAGMRPYRDFFYTQSPLMPAVYGWLAPLWQGGGVLGGRILTAAIGFAAAIAASLAAGAMAGRGRRLAAGLTVFLLLQCNVVHSYFTAIPKTYALASLFVSCGILALSATFRGGRAANCAVAGLMFAFAAGTRLSLGAILPSVGICLLALRRRHPSAWLYFGLGGAAGLLLAFLPFVAGCAEQFAFANFFHGGRSAGGCVFALGSVARTLRNYMPLALFAAAAIAAFAMTRGAATDAPDGPRGAAAFAATLAVAFLPAFAVHATAPFPYDDYQTPVIPLAAVAASALFWRALPDRGAVRDGRLLLSFAAIAAVFAFTSPFCESWLVLRKDRFWVDSKAKPDLALLRETGARLREMIPEGRPLLTQDAYLAVEARRPVPPGFEIGPFGFFAGLSDDDARKFRVLNRNLAEESFAECDAPVAAFSGYAFAMSAPELARDDARRAELLEEAFRFYAPLGEVADFGQEHTTLWIGVRRQPGDDGSVRQPRTPANRNQ